MTLAGWVILVAEDEPLIRLNVAEGLRDEGFGVIEARNAAEAMAVLSGGAGIDLLLTDIRMPGEFDGLALVEWTLNQDHRPLIAITSSDDKALAEANQRFPAALILTKPVELQTAADLFRLHLGTQPTEGESGVA